MSRLKNKVAVITGGNSGIGFGISQEFKNEGAKGVIVGRNQETLDSSVAQLGDNFIAINADVTNVAEFVLLRFLLSPWRVTLTAYSTRPC